MKTTTKKQWPCYFSKSDTTGEKEYEEFFMENESVDLDRFKSLGVVINSAYADEKDLQYFMDEIEKIKESGKWTRKDLITLFKDIVPGFSHYDKGKYLDEKM